jgi:hypothetical protein
MQFTDFAWKVIKRVTDYLCNIIKSYLSYFRKLPKVNGAPHAGSVKLGRNCIQFAKRAQITFGAIATGNLLLWNVLTKASKPPFSVVDRLRLEKKYYLKRRYWCS